MVDFFFHAWEHDYFNNHDETLSKAFLTLRLNEIQGFPVSEYDVNKQPISIAELDDVFPPCSTSYKLCTNE